MTTLATSSFIAPCVADNATNSIASSQRSVREWNVLPSNPPALNAANLQRAIDWASPRGATLWVEPSDEPYRVSGGLILRKNVSLLGAHGPLGRGTRGAFKAQPVGSVFSIEDTQKPFLTVESATQVRGLQFWYSRQTLDDPARIIAYPPTIQVSQTSATLGVTLSNLSFYGEYRAMDFKARAEFPCELITFENCTGYPLSGEFIRLDYCYDVPRILHCHVNPSNQRLFRERFSRAVVDAVIARRTFAFSLDHTDNAQLIDIFTFGTHGGAYLGPETYGQLTNFNFDCVSVGIHKLGANAFNRNWQIAQGSIIANAGARLEEIHPFLIEGRGHTSISNVEAFSGPNPALSALGQSQDFLLVRGNEPLTVSIVGCRMRNYAADEPITLQNPRASVRAVACVDKNEHFYERLIEPPAVP